MASSCADRLRGDENQYCRHRCRRPLRHGSVRAGRERVACLAGAFDRVARSRHSHADSRSTAGGSHRRASYGRRRLRTHDGSCTLGAWSGTATARCSYPFTGSCGGYSAVEFVPASSPPGWCTQSSSRRRSAPVPRFGEASLRSCIFPAISSCCRLRHRGISRTFLLALLAIGGSRPGGRGEAAGLSLSVVVRSVSYAGFSMLAGSLADRFDKSRLLASGFVAGIMALAVILLPANFSTSPPFPMVRSVAVETLEIRLQNSLARNITAWPSVRSPP